MKLLYQGEVREDGLHIYHRKDFEKSILNFLGKKVNIIIEQKKKKRSIEQNAYYWGVVVPLVKLGLTDVGYKIDKEETHDFLKSQFLKKELINEKTGEILKTVGSTQNLSTSDFMDFIAEIQQWASEFLNVYIPDPNEQIKIEL